MAPRSLRRNGYRCLRSQWLFLAGQVAFGPNHVVGKPQPMPNGRASTLVKKENLSQTDGLGANFVSFVL
jgi:hypothetical protein